MYNCMSIFEDITGNIAEELRLGVSEYDFSPHGLDRNVTITVGVVQAEVEEAPDAFIKRADESMYKGKIGGRNNVTIG